MFSGYWQVELKEEDKEKTACSTPYGLYEFNVMPFGLCGAPSLLQRLMENVLKGLQFEICLIYIELSFSLPALLGLTMGYWMVEL
jgi:hypothetical protein